MTIIQTTSTLLALLAVSLCASRNADAQPVLRDDRTPPRAEWTADSFDADAYPTPRLAAKRLAERWARDFAATRQAPVRAVALSVPDKLDRAIRDAAADALRAQFPGTEVTLSKADDELPESSDSVRVLLSTRECSGHGVLRLTSPAAPHQVAEARFYDKPWADDFAAYSNDPARRKSKWVVGWSTAPAASAAEASRDAVRSAADALLPLVLARAEQTGRPSRADDLRWHRERLESALLGRIDGLVSDRFTQRFARPYGVVWREAVLVDASPDKLDRLARDVVRETQHRQTRARSTFFSSAAVLAVVYALYLFANAVTKGYFAWRLRTAAFLAAAAGLVVLLAVVA